MHLSSSTLKVMADANMLFINNIALLGGAILLHQSMITVATGANLTFVNNTAVDKGGAIYVDPGLMLRDYRNVDDSVYRCRLLKTDNVTLSFANNSATNGGDDVYGASLQVCNVENYVPSISSVSSDPLRVCMCESPVYDKPQCKHNNLFA